MLYGAFGGLILILFHFARYLIDPLWIFGERTFLFQMIASGIFWVYIGLICQTLRRQNSGRRITYMQAFKMVFAVLATMTVLDQSYEAAFNQWKGRELKVRYEREIRETISRGDDVVSEIRLFRKLPPREIAQDADPASLTSDQQEKLEEARFQDFMKPVSTTEFIHRLVEHLIGAALLSLLLALFIRSMKTEGNRAAGIR